MLMLAVSDQVMAQFQLSRWSNSYAATKVGKGSAKTRGYAPRPILKAPSAYSVNGSVSSSFNAISNAANIHVHKHTVPQCVHLIIH